MPLLPRLSRPSRRHRARTAVLLLLALAVSACAGADPVDSAGPSAPPAVSAPPTETAAPTPTASPADAATSADVVSADPVDADAAASAELPQFANDFNRICSTGVGFGGAASYEPTAGVHPVLLFEEQGSGTLITAAVELPAGWAVVEDADFEDATELAGTELVACATVADRTPNGTRCELEGDDGATTTLELVDATYQVAVHVATTGEVLGTETIQAATTECPFFVLLEEGQTEYLNSPTDDQYTQALRAYVTPA